MTTMTGATRLLLVGWAYYCYYDNKAVYYFAHILALYWP